MRIIWVFLFLKSTQAFCSEEATKLFVEKTEKRDVLYVRKTSDGGCVIQFAGAIRYVN
jgi:hypothetical protein